MNMPLVLLNRRRRGFTAFSPSTLFALAEPGVWFDPSDLTTLYQDPAGTTPVTTPGQTVGLMLDKSKGLALGAELVANGDFSNPVTTGWVAGGSTLPTLSVVSGELSINTTTGSNYPGASYAFTTVVGRTYRVTLTARTNTTNASSVYIRDSGGNYITDRPSIGTANTAYNFAFVARQTSSNIYIFEFINTAGTGTIFADNISVRELPGNHATQATLASRPIYGIEPVGGRRNLLTYSEQFDNAVWVLNALGVGVLPTRTLNAGTSPAGVTACRLAFSLGGGTATSDMSIFYQAATIPAGAGVSSVWLRSFDGTSSYTMQLTDPTGASQSITVTGAWQRFQVTATSSGAVSNYQLRLRGGQTPVNSSAADVLFSQPQVETGSTATAYQRTTTQYDVTEAGVASTSYLAFDGVDDGMVTGTITPGVDKAQVFAGVRKISDAAEAIMLELNTTYDTSTGAFAMYAPGGISVARDSAFVWASKGTLKAFIGPAAASFPAPITNVLTGLGDISGDRATVRLNGTQAAQSTADQGTGNYGNYPLYIGRRGGSSLPFSGRVYSLITRFGANLDAGVITNTETWVAGKTGISL